MANPFEDPDANYLVLLNHEVTCEASPGFIHVNGNDPRSEV